MRLRCAAAGAALLAVCALSYEMFVYIIPNLYYMAIGNGFHGKFSFGPWHSIYIGLGWEENKYGIQCADEYGMAVAAELDPTAVYGSARYMEVLRGEWFRLWREDPGYMLGTYFRKVLTGLKNDLIYSINGSDPGQTLRSTYLFAASYSGFSGRRWLPAFAVCAAFLRYLGRQKDIFRPYGMLLLFTAVCVFVGLDMGILQRPWTGYIFGSYAGCSMLFIFVSAALVSAAEKALERLAG